MLNRLLALPLSGQQSIFLFGPFGTGKTFWLKKYVPDALYFDLLDFSVYSLLVAQPNRLESLIPLKYDGWVIIDEVQRVPELLNEVHRLIEHKHHKFILTGSSARSLRRRGVNLLAGRALIYHMHPLTVQELGDQFDLQGALTYGLLPSVFIDKDIKKYLESYVQVYVREEVLQEGLTRNVGAFNHFLEVASFSQGSVLTISDIARELSLSRSVVTSYFDIVDDLLLARRLQVFSQRAKRKLVAHQKFYFFDTGVFRAVRPTGPLDTREEVDGAALGTLFLQSLCAVNDYFELGYGIHFWRTSAGHEVDFVLYGPRGLHAFEIKRASTIANKDLRGLKAFKEDYPEATLHVLYAGKQREYPTTDFGAVTLIPFEMALRELPQIIG